VYCNGIDRQWGLVRKDMLAPEKEYSLQGRRNLANIHSSDQWAQSTARNEYFPQGHQECEYIFEQGR